MITRFYANNFRCLVNFEMKFDSLGVLCGPNGMGKSTVMDALGVLCGLATGTSTTEQLLKHGDHTLWLESDTVQFEIDMQILFPKDRIENWVEFPNTGKTDEVREAAKKLGDGCRTRSLKGLPPSLAWSCGNWQELEKRFKS